MESSSVAFDSAVSFRKDPVGKAQAGKGVNVFGPSYSKAANDQVVTSAMIETEAAVNDLDDILTVPEIDGIYIGPADLTLSTGFTGSHQRPKRNAAEVLAQRFILITTASPARIKIAPRFDTRCMVIPFAFFNQRPS
jgi:2-keto-3-deoxy-L-rhamnonate aldolase RhmA